MDDFSAKVGAKNLYGLVGNEANKVEAGKRPLSSMSPTIVMKNGRGFMTLGTPNGPRIITCVAQTLLNRMGFDMPLKQSVLRRRIHHQWLPDKILLEPDMFDEQMINSLKKRGP
jgi:gamma-glutamyltranspeptidase/glutathione hydrolase